MTGTDLSLTIYMRSTNSNNLLGIYFLCFKTRELIIARWRHQMKTFSALLALCVGNSQVAGEFPSQRRVTRSFDVFFHLSLNKRLSKQSWGWWFEMPSPSLWRHCNGQNIRDVMPIQFCCIRIIVTNRNIPLSHVKIETNSLKSQETDLLRYMCATDISYFEFGSDMTNHIITRIKSIYFDTNRDISLVPI